MTGPTEQTGYGEIPNTLLAGISHTPLVSDMNTPGFGNMYAGLIHSDLRGDVHNPGIGEIGTGPVRSCGIMEGGFIGDMETTIIGEIPIGPARVCGDIYGTGVFGDIHAGLWAGYMITGTTALRPGDTETT